ncbi:Chaperone DnaJ-domain superfamily protein [Arabidopsis thaliana]|uniref:Chaperone DnaJ-domain superfamily protein n=1 Tax=Arabidopsis thaliana TaxID=3702 RepID=A0A1P8AWI9_ARATH|nr:Chaperone DnaJ-domain superfamily protein [Arabidopsis thaliana]ANM61029.1 Chaperone DnaJ-domain superfamily protein [Arabidopsis thaliana]|eukprot:NP_001323273.1 Chaperone DnaJ-domain superfamily protein [Arabidopsis thaliana]
MEGGIRQTYYEILGVAVDSSAEQIRRAYHKLAKIWHPDRWTKDPFRSGEAKRRFQQIQEAYSVLSDERKRSSYDVGLYDSGEDEGYFDFVQEMVSLMSQTKREVNLIFVHKFTDLVLFLLTQVNGLIILTCRKSNTAWKSYRQWSMTWSMSSNQNHCSRTNQCK